MHCCNPVLLRDLFSGLSESNHFLGVPGPLPENDIGVLIGFFLFTRNQKTSYKIQVAKKPQLTLCKNGKFYPTKW